MKSCRMLLVLLGSWISTPVSAVDQVDVLQEMTGIWRTTSIVRDGLPVAESWIIDQKSDGTYTLWVDDRCMGTGLTFFDPVTKHYDCWFTHFEDGSAAYLHLGLFELKGDTYVECTAEVGRSRPTSFSSRRDSGRTLATYQRD